MKINFLSKQEPKKKGIVKFDRLFFIIVILLSLIGTLAVYTAGSAYAAFRYSDEFYFIKRQILWLVIGITVMVLSSKLDIRTVYRFTPIAYFGTLILLIMTLVIGFVGNGAQRWISIGPITIQPSEIAKLTLVAQLAAYFTKYKDKACESGLLKESFLFGTIIPFAIMLLPIILVMLQKHLSCIIILGLIGLCMISLSGTSLKFTSGFVGLGAAFVSCIALFTDYTKDRITVWLDPEAYKLTGGWQTLQGLMAIGSGGLFGKGLGNGELKHCYVSEPANDMIFTIVCEELGFFGCAIIILLFGILIFEGFNIALRSDDRFSRLLVMGIMLKVAIQTLLNIAVVTNSIPNTGISLPFFSYGGSSLIMLFFEMGIVLSVSERSRLVK